MVRPPFRSVKRRHGFPREFCETPRGRRHSPHCLPGSQRQPDYANADAVNPDPADFSELTQFTQTGKFVSQFQVDSQIGGAFGIAVERVNGEVRFAVDDVTNTVSIWTL